MVGIFLIICESQNPSFAWTVLQGDDIFYISLWSDVPWTCHSLMRYYLRCWSNYGFTSFWFCWIVIWLYLIPSANLQVQLIDTNHLPGSQYVHCYHVLQKLGYFLLVSLLID